MKNQDIKEYVDKCIRECKFDVDPLPDNRTTEEKEADFIKFMEEPIFPNYSKENFKKVFDFVMKDR